MSACLSVFGLKCSNTHTHAVARMHMQQLWAERAKQQKKPVLILRKLQPFPAWQLFWSDTCTLQAYTCRLCSIKALFFFFIVFKNKNHCFMSNIKNRLESTRSLSESNLATIPTCSSKQTFFFFFNAMQLKHSLLNKNRCTVNVSNSILVHSFNSTAVRDQDKDSVCQTFVIYSTYQIWCKWWFAEKYSDYRQYWASYSEHQQGKKEESTG